MASIQPKVISGKTYYYLVESGRVGGKPRIVSQRYLGSAEDIAAALDGATATPARTRHLAFGDVAAVWGCCPGWVTPRPSTRSSGPAAPTPPPVWAPTWR